MPLSVAAQDTQPTTQDDVTRQQLKELQTAASDVEVTPLSGPKVHGRIQWFDDVSFALREKNGQERTWRYSEVVKVRKKGMSLASHPSRLASCVRRIRVDQREKCSTGLRTVEFDNCP
jgi:hypothetical protein